MRTTVGYAGGTTEHPTYQNIGDHSESLRVVYNPERIGYEELLRIFWNAHDPTRPAFSRQYASRIFVASAEQRRAAEASKEELEAGPGRPVVTEIRELEGFTPAEPYHQKYVLRQNRAFWKHYLGLFGSEEAVTASTAAARVNGYLGGHGTAVELEGLLPALGLPGEMGEKLLERVRIMAP